jgi:hypothetical protein
MKDYWAQENISPEPQAAREPTGEDIGHFPIDGVLPSSGIPRSGSVDHGPNRSTESVVSLYGHPDAA